MRSYRKVAIEKDHYCPVCSKRFTVWDHSTWAYKTNNSAAGGSNCVYLCSYKCKGIWDKENDKKKRWHKAY